MNVGIIGAGRMGQVLARLSLRAGHNVALANSRAPESLSDLIRELGERASAARPLDVVQGSDLCILATRWEHLPAVASAVGDMRGRITVDATNNRFGPGPNDVYDTAGRPSSEIVAELFPGAPIVKAFNNQPIAALAGLLHPNDAGRRALFIAGDDAGAKQRVARLIDDFDATAIDAGDLHVGGRLMATNGGPLAGLGRLLSVTEAEDLLERARTRPASPPHDARDGASSGDTRSPTPSR